METANLVQAILGADNTARQRAETQLNSQRTTDPAGLMQLFMTNMQSDKPEVAQISCVLFKKYFLENSEGVSPNDLQQMQEAVMASLDFKTQPLLLLKRKGDVIAKIYALRGENEALLKLVAEWAQTADSAAKQFALYVFEILSECHLTPAQLTSHQAGFHTIFEQALQDGDMKVKVAALKATVTFLSSIEDEAVVNSFRPLMGPILNIMVEALKSDETQGKLALESMVELTKAHPQAWKDAAGQLVEIVSQIITAKDFEEGTRSQAAEVVLTLASQSPASLRKLDQAKTQFFPALVQMLAECEEDDETWAATDNEDGTGNDVHSAAIAAIGRFSIDMKENFILEAATPVFQQSLTNEDWKIRQAGYMTYGLVAESCRDFLKANLDSAMQTACKGLGDAHLRVRYAALSCVALVLTELSPVAQQKYHQELVPALLKIIKEEQSLKLQTHGLSCLINFTNGLIVEDDQEINETKKSGEILTLYADQLFACLQENLKKGIQESYEPLQEEVLNLLNVSATLIEEQFAPHYNSFMPLMLEILKNVEGKTLQQQTLRARTFESIGYMIAAVSEDKSFLGSVQEVTEKLFTLLQQTFAHDDPQEVAVKEALTKVAFYLKEDFNAVAPKFLEILVADANLDIDIQQENAELPSAQATTSQSFEFKLKGMENKTRVTLNTSALGNKIAAFQHILKISEAMGSGFQPYIAAVLPVLKANIGHFSRAIRKAALKTFQYLLVAQGAPTNVAFFKELYGLLGMSLVKAHKNRDVKEMKLLFKALFHCMRVISQNDEEENQRFFESAAQMQAFGALMKQCLECVWSAKNEQLAIASHRNTAQEIDEEDEAEVKEELYKITGAATYINECADIIMTTYKTEAAALIDDSCKFYFANIVQQYKTVSERELADATFFFMEFVEHCNSTDSLMVYGLCAQFVEIAMWAKPEMSDVRQNTVYGIGAMCQHLTTAAFQSLVAPAVTAVETVLSDPEAQGANLVVTENALITLGKLALLHTQDVAQAEQFVASLPLTQAAEAQEAHEFLFTQVLAGHALLSGACKPAVVKAVTAIRDAHAQNGELLTEEGVEQMNQVVGGLGI